MTMPIMYYPGEWAKMKMHVIEQQQQPNMLHSVFGTQNLSSGMLLAGVWCPKGWEVRRVSLNFDDATSKDYSVSIVRGVGIVAGKNDRLWIKVDTVPAQEAIIPQGFYTGDTLATAIATALNACDFPTASKPFTVVYGSSTGLFTISPASGNAKLLTSNTTVRVRWIGTAAPLIGFTTDTGMTTDLVSDTAVGGMGTEMAYLSASGSSSLNIMSTDVVAMTTDDQLLVAASCSTGIAAYEVVYKILDV